MDQLLQQVQAKITQLYDPQASKEVKQEANSQLEQFQRAQEAWIIADALLTSSDNQLFCSFGASTLKSKIQHDLEQLSQEAQGSLQASVIQQLMRTQSKHIRIHLTIALIRLAMERQVWLDPFQDLVTCFGPTHKNLLLEFVRLLPEEVRSVGAVADHKAEFHKQRVEQLLQPKNALIVLELVLVSLDDEALRESATLTLCNWIVAKALSFNGVEVQKLTQLLNVIMTLLMEALKDGDDLSEALVDVLVEIVRDNSSQMTPQVLQVREVIFDHLKTLNTMTVQANMHLTNESYRDLTRLYTEVAETYLDSIRGDYDSFGFLVLCLLYCVSYKSKSSNNEDGVDLSVLSITFDFWFELTRIVLSDDQAVGNHAKDLPSLHQKNLEVYKQLMVSLIAQFTYPLTAVDNEGMSAQEKEAFRDFRHQAGDVVKDCVMVVGQSEALQVPWSALHQAQLQVKNGQKVVWQEIEGSLFALRVMGSQINDESVVLPQIMHIIPQLVSAVESNADGLVSAFGSVKIRYASVLVLGRYAHWTSQHPQFITEHLAIIYRGFSGGEELCSASALALKYLCESCGSLLIPFLKDLHSLYLNALQSLPFYEIMELTEAMALIVNSVPITGAEGQDLTSALKSFCMPIGEQLFQSVQSVEVNYQYIDQLVQRLAIFFKRVNPKVSIDSAHPCLQLFESCLSIFEKLLMDAKTPYNTIDFLCRLFKKVMVSYENHPQMNQIVQSKLSILLSSSFAISNNPGLLWVTTHIVRRFAKQDITQPIKGMVEQELTCCFQLLNSAQRFNELNELVDDFTRLMSACTTTSLAQLFYSTEVLSAILDFMMLGFQAVHVNVLEALMDFQAKLIAEALDPANTSAHNQINVLRQVMSSRLLNFISIILYGVSGQNEAKMAYNTNLIADVAHFIMHLSDLMTPQIFGTLLEQALLQLQQSSQISKEKLSTTVIVRVIEGYKAAVERRRSEPLRFALQSLSAAFKMTRRALG